ncbi:MAG: type II toxin-antitoxin system Phd/YefM family antitoxin [Thermodesulfobacterium sp.]|nr:type II toxin-antitoxin system Phd/YefM family antitoxin [Thermodesulfobacterium sp.]
MAKKTISITEGRKKLFKIAEELQRPDTYYTFTVDGKPRVVLMSQEEFDSIMETMEILSDPKALKEIEKAENGEFYDWEDVKKELGLDARNSTLIREKPKRKYGADNKKKARNKKKK